MHHRIGILVAASVVGLSGVARAEQFVLVDESYTHSTQTTKDSHYYPALPDSRPKDWTQPVDYSHGSVHIILDIATKPAGDAPTKYQACFEGTPSYGCTLQSPTYTKPGRVEWDSPFKDFWYESTVDWSKGVQRMPLILKDTNNGKPAGDPKYMPTDLHVQVTLVSAGAKFVPPPAAGSGGSGAQAGTGAGAGGGAAGSGGRHGDAAGHAAGHDAAGAVPPPSAGRASAAAAGAGGSVGSVDAPGSQGRAGERAAAPSGNAGTSAGRAGSTLPAVPTSPSQVAGSGAAVAGNNGTAPANSGVLESTSGCRTVGGGAGGAWPLASVFGYWVLRRRRARLQSQA